MFVQSRPGLPLPRSASPDALVNMSAQDGGKLICDSGNSVLLDTLRPGPYQVKPLFLGHTLPIAQMIGSATVSI